MNHDNKSHLNLNPIQNLICYLIFYAMANKQIS